MDPIIYAFILTIIAGLSTGIGSLIAYFIKKPKISYLAFSLGLSGGVMIYVSFMELLPEGMESLGETESFFVFLLGIAVIGIIDVLIPDLENPHHYSDEKYIEEKLEEKQKKEEQREKELAKTKKRKAPSKRAEKNQKLTQKDRSALLKTGAITAVAIAIHNFPEGLATFGVALGDPAVALVVTIAIAIHNIPEGVSVSIPIFYATKDKKKAFLYSFMSGVAEPIGAVLGYFILRSFMNDKLIGGLLAFVAGIMVYISFDEILPTAHRYETAGHLVILGIIIGIVIMGVSLLIL